MTFRKRLLFAVLAGVLAGATPALALSPAQRLITSYAPPAPAAAGGGCSQATAALARVSGGVNTSAYTTGICALVTAGIWSTYDTFFILATDTSADALVNLVSSSFPATAVAAPTFTANKGFAFNGTTQDLTVPYTFSTSGGQWTRNSASFGAWSIEPSGTPSNGCSIGGTGAGFDNILSPFTFGSVANIGIQTGTNISSATIADGTGMYLASRTSATQLDGYKNGVNGITSAANASTPLQANTITIGNCTGTGWYNSTVALAHSGSGLSSAQAATEYTIVHTMLNSISAANFP